MLLTERIKSHSNVIDEVREDVEPPAVEIFKILFNIVESKVQALWKISIETHFGDQERCEPEDAHHDDDSIH